MADLFRCFADLALTQVEGIDFRRIYRSGHSGLLVMAPHGGGIEFMTAPLAEAIAGTEHAVYRFEGCKKGGGNGCLHITSTNFDEPIAREAVRSHQHVLAIHGAKETDRPWVMVGGLGTELRQALSDGISEADFAVEPCDTGRGARDPDNICNMSSGQGAQLELSAALRQSLRNEPDEKAKFVDAVRGALAAFG